MRPGFGVVGRPTRRGFSGSEKARLILLSVVALALFAVFVQVIVRARSRPRAEGPPLEPRPPSVVARPPIDTDLLRRETRDGTATERTELEATPREHLLSLARNLSPAHFEVSPVPDLASLKADPAAHRGEYYRMRGRILHLERIDLGPGTTPYHRGALDLEDGGIAFFAVLDPAEATSGDFVRLDGVFWKNYGGNAGERGFREGPLFVARNLVFSFERIAPVAEIEGGLLERVRDGTAGEKEVIERDPHLHLLAFARDADAVGDFADAPELDVATVKELIANPAPYRGKPFRIFGRAEVLVSEVREENPVRLERLTAAWIFNFQTGVQLVHFPGLVETVRPKDLAWIDAYFLKNYAYEATDGETRQVPLFVAKRFERYVEPESAFAKYITAGALASAGVTLVVFLYALFSKERKGGRRALAQEIAARRAARRASAPPAAGGPSA